MLVCVSPTCPRYGRFDAATVADRDGLRTARNARITPLLFFSLYLFFSIVAVAYDYHDPSYSKICPLCFMRSSLSSAVGQAIFVPQVDDQPQCLILAERSEPRPGAAFTPGVPYRGPPSTGVHSWPVAGLGKSTNRP